MERMAAASASALRRRASRSAARAASSAARALDSTSAFSRSACCCAARAAASPAWVRAASVLGRRGLGFLFGLLGSVGGGAFIGFALTAFTLFTLALLARFALVALLRELFLLAPISSACWRASSSRRVHSRSCAEATADSGSVSAWACSPTSAGAPMSAVASAMSSRLMKVRFLRTSTWMVRALPLASACLISVVDFSPG